MHRTNQARGPGPTPAGGRPSLARELWAILTLYGALAIVPLLMGLGCGDRVVG